MASATSLSTHKRVTASERAARVADRARLADLEAQISELQRSLQALQEEQSFLQERLDAYIYPVLTLPPEIVSEIFVHFLPVYPRRPPTAGLLAPTKLGQICRIWREIAFSTPALWRAISVSVPEARSLKRMGTVSPGRRREMIKGESLVLEASLKYSGTLPLSIAVVTRFIAQHELAPLIETISAHSARWEHMKLQTTLKNICAIKRPLLSLHSLTIGLLDEFSASPLQLTAFLPAPLLRRVALQQYNDIYHSTLPWTQLTVLIVDEMPAHQCASILNLAARLVYCRLTIRERPGRYADSNETVSG